MTKAKTSDSHLSTHSTNDYILFNNTRNCGFEPSAALPANDRARNVNRRLRPQLFPLSDPATDELTSTR
jgi:hypothetical protein